MELVLIAKSAGVAVLTLNRPEAMNALSRALRRALTTALAAVAADQEVRAVVLTGAGERAFCAGLDLKEIGTLGLGGASDEGDPIRALEALRMPVIAAVNGVAVTGGLELMLACDLALASAKARFADTHLAMGVIPGWGLSQRLSRAIGLARAKEMSLAGAFIDAPTAQAWGLVNRLTAPEELLPAALATATAMAGADPALLARYKGLIEEGFDLSLTQALRLERRVAAAANADLAPKDLGAAAAAVLRRGRGEQGLP